MRRDAFTTFAFLFAALLVAVLPGCDSDDTDSSSERTRLLTAEAWALESTEVEPDDGTIEVTAIAERYDFEEGGDVTVAFEEGGTRMGTWRFTDGETKIRLDAGTQREVTADVLELTEKDFRFRIRLSAAGQEITVTTNLGHP